MSCLYDNVFIMVFIIIILYDNVFIIVYMTTFLSLVDYLPSDIYGSKFYIDSHTLIVIQTYTLIVIHSKLYGLVH